MKTESERIEATMSKRRIVIAGGSVVRIEDARLPKRVTFGELVGGVSCVGRQEKESTGCLLEALRAFDINADQWTTATQDEGEWCKTAGKGTEHFRVE